MEGLKKLRENSGITQKEAAQILGVAVRTYQDWELGKRNPKNPDDVIEKIKAIGILNREGINSILDKNSDLGIEWAMAEKKRRDVECLSKWGSMELTFQKNWERIPYEVRTKLNAEELALLVDAVKKAYDDGYQDGRK